MPTLPVPQFFRLFPACFGLLLLSGCQLIGYHRPETPPGFRDAYAVDRMGDPATLRPAYVEIFPPQPHVTLTAARVLARGRWGLGGEAFRMNYSAAGDDLARLRAYVPQVTAPYLDVIVNERRMAVLLGDTREAFVGPTRPTSPFGRVFGVEPRDLSRILLIGQRVAAGGFRVDRHRKSFSLYPLTETELAEVEIDKQTGLPRRAVWSRADRAWRVEYHAWGQTPTDAGPLLMPTRVVIRPSEPDISLTVSLEGDGAYRLQRPPSDRMYEVPDLAGRYEIYPLERLTEALTGR